MPKIDPSTGLCDKCGHPPGRGYIGCFGHPAEPSTTDLDPREFGSALTSGRDVDVDVEIGPPPNAPATSLSPGIPIPLFVAAIGAGLLSTFAAGFLVGHVVAAGSVAPIRADLVQTIAERDQLAAELAELADASRSTVGAAYAGRGDLRMKISDLEVDLRLAREALAECQGAAP